MYLIFLQKKFLKFSLHFIFVHSRIQTNFKKNSNNVGNKNSSITNCTCGDAKYEGEQANI